MKRWSALLVALVVVAMIAVPATAFAASHGNGTTCNLYYTNKAWPVAQITTVSVYWSGFTGYSKQCSLAVKTGYGSTTQTWYSTKTTASYLSYTFRPYVDVNKLFDAEGVHFIKSGSVWDSYYYNL